MPLHVVILAAGQGKRMHSALPKVLHRIAGRPLLAHVIDAARSLKPDRIYVVHGHGGAEVQSVFEGAGVEWVEQARRLGTGHALMQALPKIPRAATVLVLNGDVPLLRGETLRKLVRAAGKGVAIATSELSDPSGYGRVVRDAKSRVQRIVEHKDATRTELAIREWYAGFLAGNASRLAGWLAKVANRNAQKEYYLTDVIRIAAASGAPVNAVKAANRMEVAGVNSREELAILERAYQHAQARKLLASGVALADLARIDVRGELVCGQDVAIDVNCVFEGRVKLGDGVKIGPNCVLKNVTLAAGSEVLAFSLLEDAEVGAGCRIGPYARLRPGAQLAEGVHIGNFVEVKASRIGKGSKANHLSYIGDSDVGRGVNIGAGTITCNYDGVAKNRTVIEDDCFIGSDATLVAPVRIRKGSYIGAGSTISKDTPPGQLTVARAAGVDSALVAAAQEAGREEIAVCGIVGAAARRDIVPVLVEGLKRLEYRGYDSCGVAAVAGDRLQRLRSVARVADLASQIAKQRLTAETGIAHTRWATHGAPVTRNAHPIFSRDEIALVHNGIIENHDELRAELKARGYAFDTQTDTEVIAHLVHSLYAGSLFDAVRGAVKRLAGAYAIAVVSSREPHRVVGARAGNPLVVGEGKGEMFLASDALALAGTTDRIAYLEEGDVAEISLTGFRVVDARGREARRPVKTVQTSGVAAELGPYSHFMQKEIFEQPRAVGDTLSGVGGISPALFDDPQGKVLGGVKSVLILACGTSYYSGLTAKYWIESLARLPVQVEVASEYRYRDSVPDPKMLVVVVSQSGETADTLAALKHARAQGQKKTLAICNVATSAMMRETRLKFLTHAGVEIGVASTKAFPTQLVALFLLALTLAKLGGKLPKKDEQKHLRSLRHLPKAIAAVLALEPQVIAWSQRFAKKENALFLGRGLHYPIALEGALKLKEISYIHAEAYPAGELKHGPLALVTAAMPVVTVAPNDALLEKLKSNMQEVRARGGELYVLADADTHIVSSEGVNVIRLPEHYGPLSPILHVVPLQLLAYHTALARGSDVDKPRNLAKSVTVE